MNILIVEDDSAQADAVEAALQHVGYSINRVHCGEHAVRFLKSNQVDLLVLDWQLPGMSGFEVLHWIRCNLGDKPAVLFVTAKMLEVDIVRALKGGADDYVVKPFRAAEFSARVEALLRRMKGNEKVNSTITVGPYVLDTVRRTASFRDKVVSLTVKEFDLVAFIFGNVGQIVPKDLLGKLAWGRELDSTSRTLDTHIYRLRQKLALRPENGVRLSTVYAHGYRLDVV